MHEPSVATSDPGYRGLMIAGPPDGPAFLGGLRALQRPSASAERCPWTKGGHGRVLAAAVLLAFLSTVLLAAAAHAHSGLLSSTPANGATVGSFHSVTLRFTEEIQPQFTKVVMTTDDDRPVALAAPAVRGREVTAGLAAGGDSIGPGLYIVAYRIVSADGHPVSGALAFTVAESSSATASTVPTSASVTDPADAAGRAFGSDEPSASSVAVMAAVLIAIALLLANAAVFVSRRRRESNEASTRRT
jgi:copper resistance protein C